MRQVDEQRINKKRSNLKNFECISKIAEMYVLAVILSHIILWQKEMWGIEKFIPEIANIIIWIGYFLLTFIACGRILKRKKEILTTGRSGKRILNKDIRNVVLKTIVVVVLYINLNQLAVRDLLAFEQIFLKIGSLPIIINLILIKCFMNQKKVFR